MYNMEKTYSFHLVIVPANHVTTECFIDEGCTGSVRRLTPFI